MTARFLVDESLPRAVTRVLGAAGHDVADARDVGLRGRPDGDVAARAVAEQRILVASDLDFANTLQFPPGSHAGIVVLRVPDDWGSRRRAERLLAAIEETGVDNIRSRLTIVEAARIRTFGVPSG